MTTKTIDIPIQKPHSKKQYDLITYPGNIAAFCGRRWGKTDGNVQRIYYHMQKNHGLYWWVGLSWQSASMKRAWRAVTHIARKVYKELNLDERNYINRTRHEVIIPGMGEIWFRTGDNPPSLAGEGVQGAVVDEFTLMAEEVWTEYLRATLLDYGGWVAFSGVPKGLNWAGKLWQECANWDGWVQLHATTYENPFINKKLIDDIRATESTYIFEQEYLAEIKQGEGAVFRNIKNCMHAPLTPSRRGEFEQFIAKHKGHYIVGGGDWGKHADFTVFSIGCINCKEELLIDRFNRIDYIYQRKRLELILKRYGVNYMLLELNSIGEPNYEELLRGGFPVGSFYTSPKTKPPLIENLALCFEAEEWQFQDNSNATNELIAYERNVSQSGHPSYSAPEGMHDDTVMARALMVWNGNNTATIINNPFDM